MRLFPPVLNHSRQEQNHIVFDLAQRNFSSKHTISLASNSMDGPSLSFRPTGSNATASPSRPSKSYGGNMLWTICVVLVVLWLLGMVSSYTLGGFIHILLVLALIVLLVRLVQGRRLVS
jgi:hypothetical protein